MSDYVERILEEVEEREAMRATLDSIIATSVIAEFRGARHESD